MGGDVTSDVYVGSNLINLHCCCKKILDAQKMFDEMTERTVVSWNSVVSYNCLC